MPIEPVVLSSCRSYIFKSSISKKVRSFTPLIAKAYPGKSSMSSTLTNLRIRARVFLCRSRQCLCWLRKTRVAGESCQPVSVAK